MQLRPSSARTKPVGQRHEKEPGLFLHSALLPHAFKPVIVANTHSSISTTHNMLFIY